MAKVSNKRYATKADDSIDKIKLLFAKLDSTWGRILLIGTFIIAGYNVGRVHEEIIQLKKQNEMENKLNNALFDAKEKYLKEIIDLKIENNHYKIGYEQKK